MPGAALAEIQDTYLTLDRNYDTLWAACKNDDQKNDLKAAYSAARDAFNAAVGKTLADGDARVLAETAQLQDLNKSIKDSLASLQNIATVIGDITSAVGVAAKLATMVVAA